MFFSNRLYIAIFSSILLHLLAVIFTNYNNVNYHLPNDLFNNKISINFSKIINTNNINELKDIKEPDIIAKNKVETITQSEVIAKNTRDISKNKKEIPYFDNFEIDGQKIMPQYPKRALKKGWQGVVYLKILVSDDGFPEQVIFSKKSQYNLLNQAALNAVLQWKFKAANINGQKSKMWIEVPIEFKIS